MNGLLIDPGRRVIEPMHWSYTNTMREHLPGGITVAWQYPNGDVLYVDDEGLLRPAERAFRIKDRPDGQPMMSNGVLTGRDHGDTTLDPAFTAEQLAERIEWLTIPQALGWYRARALRPAVVSTSQDGTRQVHAVWAEFLANLEGAR